MTKILEVKNLKKYFPVKKLFQDTKWVKALDGVSFDLEKKQTLAIVGESGCGKTTLAKVLMQMESPTEGSYLLDGKAVSEISKSEYRQTVQMIFQDPYSSINPRKKAWQIISEPLAIQKPKLSSADLKAEAEFWMEKVGLRKDFSERYPHMFSGGQRQRIGIARALILRPKILICDEPVSALDVSIQAQVLNLLMDLQRDFDLTYIFISHDLSVVRHIADRVLVMYLGKVVELGSKKEVFENPLHPYTKALLESSPKVFSGKKDFKPLEGDLPSPLNPPSGCSFHKRCSQAVAACSQVVPALENKQGRQLSCLEITS